MWRKAQDEPVPSMDWPITLGQLIMKWATDIPLGPVNVGQCVHTLSTTLHLSEGDSDTFFRTFGFDYSVRSDYDDEQTSNQFNI